MKNLLFSLFFSFCFFKKRKLTFKQELKYSKLDKLTFVKMKLAPMDETLMIIGKHNYNTKRHLNFPKSKTVNVIWSTFSLESKKQDFLNITSPLPRQSVVPVLTKEPSEQALYLTWSSSSS